ncbi:MAG: hypothetical protein WBM86_32345, partial [Waterburya sp.]
LWDFGGLRKVTFRVVGFTKIGYVKSAYFLTPIFAPLKVANPYENYNKPNQPQQSVIEGWINS